MNTPILINLFDYNLKPRYANIYNVIAYNSVLWVQLPQVIRYLYNLLSIYIHYFNPPSPTKVFCGLDILKNRHEFFF